MENNTEQGARDERKSELSPRESFFRQLDAWTKEARLAQGMMAMYPFYLASNLQGLMSSQQTSNNNNNINNVNLFGSPQGTQQQAASAQSAIAAPIVTFNVFDEAGQNNFITRNGGQRYMLASLWKRAIAEGIDIIILLMVKFTITFVVMNCFGLDLGFDKDPDNMYNTLFEKPMDFVTFSADFLLIEIASKFIVCCYEALWTTYGNGSTPGKALLKLRVLYVEALVITDVQQVEQPRILRMNAIPALLYPAQTPNLIRSFARSLIKNTIVILFFPICVAMLFFKNNRTAYDVWAKTVVVERSSNAQGRQ